MSTSRGNINRNRPQKHQNKTAFKNDLHDTSKKTKLLNSLQVAGVCKRCRDIIQWKIKYKKYKPLTSPGKCVSCSEKTIKHAYHVLCNKCADQKNVCAKCNKPVELVEEKNLSENSEHIVNSEKLQAVIKSLPERKRRTVLRYVNKHGTDLKETPEFFSIIEEVMSGVDKINFDEFDSSDDLIDDASADESTSYS